MTNLSLYGVVAEFRSRVRRAVDGADGAQDWEQRDEIAALRALVAELLVEGARLREQVAALRGGS